MTRRKQVLVIGFGRDHCPEHAYKVAYRVGAEVARQGALLMTGGLGGVMEAASRGAKDGGGFVIGIIPQDSKDQANDFCDAVIATEIGFARDFITAYSADAVIVVGGGHSNRSRSRLPERHSDSGCEADGWCGRSDHRYLH